MFWQIQPQPSKGQRFVTSCGNIEKLFEMVYMFSSFWLLGGESRGFFQAEKERTACKAEEIHKMTTFFTQNDNLGPF